MHHCLTDHQSQLGLLFAAAGACAVLAGLLVRRQCQPRAIEQLVEVFRLHPTASERPGVREYLKRNWRFVLVMIVVLTVVESLDVPWPAYLIIGVFGIPLGLADLTLQAHAKAVARGEQLDEDWRDVWVIVTRGWPYLIGTGAVVTVACLVWVLTGSTC